MEARSLKRAGALLFIATGQFVFFFELAEIYYPGYDVSVNTVSDLGATCRSGVCTFVQPSSEIFDASVVFLGVMVLFAAYLIWRGSGAQALPFFQALGGIGAIGVGVFNESFGSVHIFVSALTFVSAGIQALLVYKVARAPYTYFSAVIGVLTLAATILYATDTFLGLGQGGMERMIVYPALIGLLGLGGYLMGFADSNPV